MFAAYHNSMTTICQPVYICIGVTIKDSLITVIELRQPDKYHEVVLGIVSCNAREASRIVKNLRAIITPLQCHAEHLIYGSYESNSHSPQAISTFLRGSTNTSDMVEAWTKQWTFYFFNKISCVHKCWVGQISWFKRFRLLPARTSPWQFQTPVFIIWIAWIYLITSIRWTCVSAMHLPSVALHLSHQTAGPLWCNPCPETHSVTLVCTDL